MTPGHECVFQLGAHTYASVQYKPTYSPNAFLAILHNSLDFSSPLLHSQDTCVACCRFGMFLISLNIQADKKCKFQI